MIDGTRQIVFRHYNGAAWEPAELLTTTYNSSSYPSVAVCSGGNVHVAWEDERFGRYEIYHRMHTAAGWQPEVRLTAKAADDKSQRPSLGAGAAGQVHLVWYDNRDVGYDIYYKNARPDQIADVPEPSVPGMPLTLSRVFPNPSTAGTEILFGLGVPASPAVSVFDVRGRKVWDLECDILPPGYHQISWDGRDLRGHRVSPGLYFLKIEAGGQSSTAKIVVLR